VSSKHRFLAALAIATIAMTAQIPSSAAFAAETCDFKPVTIMGDENDNTLTGTEGADVIWAGGGSDKVEGLGGNDTVCLGLGNDSFDGGAGDDVVVSESSAVDGNDNLNGGAGKDKVLYARRTFAVTVSLDDAFNDGQSGETDNVHSDVEWVVGGQSGDSLNGNDGPNILDGNSGVDTINGFGGVDDLFGGEAIDLLAGGQGADNIDGGGGNDFIEAEAVVDGADWLFGGTGVDTVSYQNRTTRVLGTIDAVSNDGAPGEGDNIQLDVENLIGGSGDDTLSIFGPGGPNGVFADNVLTGGPGSDTIDVVDGPAITNDTAVGGSGTDTCRIELPFDSQFECEP